MTDKNRVKKNYRTIYQLAEQYRQGLGVEMDKEKAWDGYREIVDDSRPTRERNDYYWRACYRLGMELYDRAGSIATLKVALRLVSRARELYEKRDQTAGPADISGEELEENYLFLISEVTKSVLAKNSMKVLKRVRCITDDEISLTRGKIYEVLIEKPTYYGLVDDEEEDIYLYGKCYFEVVEEY